MRIRPFALVGLLFVALFAVDCLAARRGPKTVAFYEEGRKVSCSFNVELAVTSEEQSRGLMFRDRLQEDAGMLFIFEGDKPRTFWMRNTFIPLDIIFITSGLKVVDVHDFAKPRDDTDIRSASGAKYVVEINGGQAAACRIKPGTRVKFTNFSQ
jgi:uncharacterized protein